MVDFAGFDNNVVIDKSLAVPGMNSATQVMYAPHRPLPTEQAGKSNAAAAAIKSVVASGATVVTWSAAYGFSNQPGLIGKVLMRKYGYSPSSEVGVRRAFAQLSVETGGAAINHSKINIPLPGLRDSKNAEMTALSWTRAVLESSTEGRYLLHADRPNGRDNVKGEDLEWIAAMVWLYATQTSEGDTVTWVSADSNAVRAAQLVAEAINSDYTNNLIKGAKDEEHAAHLIASSSEGGFYARHTHSYLGLASAAAV